MLTGCKRQKRMVGARADREKLKFHVQGAQGEAGHDSGSLTCKVRCGVRLSVTRLWKLQGDPGMTCVTLTSRQILSKCLWI